MPLPSGTDAKNAPGFPCRVTHGPPPAIWPPGRIRQADSRPRTAHCSVPLPGRLRPICRDTEETTFARPTNVVSFLEQAMGVEPTSSAWKADVLAVVRRLQNRPAFSGTVLLYPFSRRLSRQNLPVNGRRKKIAVDGGKQVYARSLAQKGIAEAAVNADTAGHAHALRHGRASVPKALFADICPKTPAGQVRRRQGSGFIVHAHFKT